MSILIRIVIMLTYSGFLLFLWKFVSFEWAVITGIAIIIGNGFDIPKNE